MTGRRRLPQYVSEFADRHGKMHVRFRRKGQATYYFKSVPWSADFMQEYEACMAKEAAPRLIVGASRTKPGTFSALIAAYYSTPEFTGLRDSTKVTYRGIIERFREKHGDKRVALIERQHIKAIIGAMAETPSAANNLLDRLKSLMTLALDIGLRKDDPTIRVRGFRISGDGFHTWTEDEIQQFEDRHPIGTQPRLALALMLFTGQRRSDAVTMGWQHIDGDLIHVRQQKTDARLAIRIHSSLRQVLSGTSRDNLTFIVTSHGKPFTPAGFGNWFRERCDEAGLSQCSAHGLRKAAARRLAEAGCSNQQIKAVTGHKTDKEVSRYTAAADQQRLAGQAIDSVDGGEREQTLANRPRRLAKTAAKPLIRKGP
ncbi:tyrosine-type recombinase/integrase [Kaistia sp. UC242_56]|uniref:tyrosine-type recombinase/integrase n=1 Tax=Kaistia sp. UC242_56 TaxID=3374625 RepID=UPI0037AFB1A1